jgi:glyoxylase-like metal-dependent hydrolase (beta-lactamase superfamily II)
VLVNTIGAFRPGDALSTTPETLRRMVDVNLGPALWLSQAVAPHMQRGSGVIVHITARPRVEPAGGMAAYGACKAALAHLTRTQEVEFRPHGIRVNGVAPQLLDPGEPGHVPAEVMAKAVAPEAIAAVIAFWSAIPPPQSAGRSCRPTAAEGPGRESPGSGDARSPAWRQAWARREGSHGHQGTCPRCKGDTVTSPASGLSAPALPDYAPIPRSALGPALNDQGYHVGRVERNLYWVTDGTYQAAFLTTPDGVVLFDAPPTIGHNLQRAVDEIAAANGASNTVTHLVYSHHHHDHAGAASLFDNVVRVGHEETRRLLLRDNDPARPAPEVTFQDRYTLEVAGERVELAWHGPNHSPDNIYIHFADHDALMLIDVVNAGWVPIYNLNLSEDVPGYLAAPATALSYPWTHFICGHLGRLATREDVAVHQAYIADIQAGAREALGTVDPTPYFMKYGENAWAGVQGYLDAVTDAAAKPVIAKYTGVLAAADIEIFTRTTTFAIMQSIRLDLGPSAPVHP